MAQNIVSPAPLKTPAKVVTVTDWNNNKNADTYSISFISFAVSLDAFIKYGDIGLINIIPITMIIPNKKLSFTKSFEKFKTSFSCFLPSPIRFPTIIAAPPPNPIIAIPANCWNTLIKLFAAITFDPNLPIIAACTEIPSPQFISLNKTGKLYLAMLLQYIRVFLHISFNLYPIWFSNLYIYIITNKLSNILLINVATAAPWISNRGMPKWPKIKI